MQFLFRAYIGGVKGQRLRVLGFGASGCRTLHLELQGLGASGLGV